MAEEPRLPLAKVAGIPCPSDFMRDCLEVGLRHHLFPGAYVGPGLPNMLSLSVCPYLAAQSSQEVPSDSRG